MSDYGKKLRELRGTRSRREVADACDIGASTLAMYELSERRPRDEVKKRLAEYFGTPVGWLFFDEKCHV